MLKAVIRSLAVSPDGQYLLVVLANEARLFKINADKSLEPSSRFALHGGGRKGAFIGNSDFIVLSSEGLTKFDVKDGLQTGDFVPENNCLAVAINKNGHIFAAIAGDILEAADWDALKHPPLKKLHHLASTITALAVSQVVLAAGTYDGGIWLKPLRSDEESSYTVLHKSAVNDLKFGKDADGNLQLGSASSDKTIKLENVQSKLESKIGGMRVTFQTMINGYTPSATA